MKPEINILKSPVTSQIPAFSNDFLLAEKNIKKRDRFDIDHHKYTGIKKILIADDDPAIIDVLTLMLETGGYKVCVSANKQTVAEVNRILPDLVLLDLLMSGINGDDICKQIKNNLLTKHIPVIVISANKDVKEIAINSCADDFIAKPFEMHKLLQKIARYIKA